MTTLARLGTVPFLLALAFWLRADAQHAVNGAVVSTTAPPAIDRGARLDHPARIGARAATLATLLGAVDAPYLPGSMIVKFRPGTSVDAQRALLASVGGTATPDLSYADFDIVALAATADPAAAARRLEAQPDVVYAQARYRVQPRFRPNDPLYAQQWNYPLLDMERAWDINPGAASSVVVAVLDTGLAYTNVTRSFVQNRPVILDGVAYPPLGTVSVPFRAAPELGGPARFVAPRDFIWETTVPVDTDGHGTHVAGTIGQLTNNAEGVAGMAFNVSLMPIKVIAGFWDDYFDSPFFGTDDVVARGIRYAVDNGAHVLNMSFGRSGPPAPVVQEAVAYAVSRGAFVVAAVGNDFLEGNQADRLAEFAPQIRGMVAVGAIGRDRRRATYSATGPHVELAAPGGDFARGGAAGMILQQTYDFDFVEPTLFGSFRAPRFDIFRYELAQGTSMAAPHVSALAAMLIQQGITSPAAIEAAMTRYATDLGATGRDDEYGHGLINPRASLRGMGLVR